MGKPLAKSSTFKSHEIFFNSNTPCPHRQSISTHLGESIGIGKYLGLPSIIGKKKKKIFGFIKDKIWKRISHLSLKYLSKAGKEILIKLVGEFISTYCMSIFLLPVTLEDELQKMMNNF